jgi:hypothetical protein
VRRQNRMTSPLENSRNEKSVVRKNRGAKQNVAEATGDWEMR